MNFYGIIPARFASTRFKGKALYPILGKPMFWHVYNRSKKSKILKEVYLATDDKKIFDCAKDLKVPVIMTSKKHQSGTDRVFEAASKLKIPHDSVIVNIQGDEPCIKAKMINQLTKVFLEDESVMVASLAKKASFEEVDDSSIVKVVIDSNMDALYFSRSLIPYPRDNQQKDNENYLQHIGLYAYKMKALDAFSKLKKSKLEKIEKLEQLRFLENNIKIRISLTKEKSIGVDYKEDIKKAEEILRQKTKTLPNYKRNKNK